MRVAIAGGGLAGLACAKYLVDAGHQPTVFESRDVIGGLVAAWKDEDGDWYETGLHAFFGAYPNMLQLLKELGIEDRLQWKEHALIFNQPEKPGTYSYFKVPDILAPFNVIMSILRNNEMLTWEQKIRFAIGLWPGVLRGQKYVEEMDRYSFLEWIEKQGIGARVSSDIFIAATKALTFLNPEYVSATVMLTPINRFLRERYGSKIAFLDGSPTERLCQPLVNYIVERGGQVLLEKPLKEIVLNDDLSVQHFTMRGLNGQPDERVQADLYVSAMSVDVMKALMPPPWKTMPFFQKMEGLEGVPVINLHLWFDRKLTNLDHLLFSRSDILSVYADMSVTCDAYADPDRSMLELVLAPAKDWIDQSDEAIIAATLKELERLFPQHLTGDNPAQLRKYKVVKTPRSVYTASPGCQACRPDQVTPIANFYLAGSYTLQRYLGSMEGAVLSGKLAAQAIIAAESALPPQSLRPSPAQAISV
ncbi:MAG: 15-cis-phytoene desaturase [Thermosynechococcaceae cyanobacterium]